MDTDNTNGENECPTSIHHSRDTEQITMSENGANDCTDTKCVTPSDPTSDSVITEETLSKLDQDDSIGDTVFSKAWVLSILVDVIQSVEMGGATTDELCCHGRTGEGTECLEEGDCGEELDEQLEGRVCTLWDASMNNDVAKYIHGLGGIDLLLGAACRSHQPRLTEICLGIIGNIVCIQEICSGSFETTKERARVLQFFHSTDSGVLCQTTRLVQTCLSYDKLQSKWLSQIMDSPHVKESLLFILQGSTNDELLASTSSLLDHLLNISEDLLKEWAEEKLVEAICEAANQVRSSNFTVSCTLIGTLHTLTSEQKGVTCVLSCAEMVSIITSNFFSTAEELDNHQMSITALTAACSLYRTLRDEKGTQKYDRECKKTLENIRKRISKSKETEQLFRLFSDILSK